MRNIDSVLESRGITLLMKVHIGKAVVFPVVMYDVRVAPVAVLLLLRSLLCPHSRTCFQVVM